MQQISRPTGRALTLIGIAALLSLSVPARTAALASTARRAPALHATTDNRRIDGHVYVGDVYGDIGLTQYPIVSGVMQTTPSATISNASAPVTLADGELYASASSPSSQTINVYAVPGLTLKRSLDIPGCPGISDAPMISAMTVGPTGDLFMLYACGIASEGFLIGVLVYPPGASGNQQPLQNIQIGLGYTVNAYGLAVDHQDQLYVAITTLNEIQVFAHPAVSPKVARTIDLSYSPNQIVVDRSADELYVDPYQQGMIYVYADKTHGSPQPQRQIQPTDGSGSEGIATYGPYLFFISGPGVNELYKRRNGSQTPIATITDGNADSVAAGP